VTTPDWFLKRNVKAWLLLPLAALYYLAGKIVYFFRLFRQKTSKRPVICIGNILAGGVGKTPVVMEIAKRINAPVVMRGYGRDKKAGDIGDEAKMMQKAGIMVLVGDRKKNICALNDQAGGPIVMDDGFQNPTIKKDISILVFDQGIGLGNGFLLPAGPLREPRSAVKRADAVIIIRGQKKNPKLDIPKGVPVFYAFSRTIMPKTSGRIVAFAGIGYPQKFFNAIGPIAVETRGFADHHQYSRDDLDMLFALAKQNRADLVTTQKDWVRLPPDAQKKIRAARLEMSVQPAFWDWLFKRLRSYPGIAADTKKEMQK
jgi:tetraacyldisaccharide 4'-kinase